MKARFALIIVILSLAILSGCAAVGAALPVVCSTIEQICAYKGLLCTLKLKEASMNPAEYRALEALYRERIAALGDSLKTQAQPIPEDN